MELQLLYQDYLKRKWNYLNGGEIFRSAAFERNITIEFSALCKNDLDVDKSLDNTLKGMTSSDSPEIIESRLCGWWAQELKLDCIKIWISASDIERAKNPK